MLKFATIAPLLLLLLSACSNTMSQKAPQNPLMGSEWRLTALSGQPVEGDARATLSFASATSVSGSGGCNNFVGGVSVTPDTASTAEAATGSILLGNLASTRKACLGEVMALEDSYLAALGQVTGYRREGGVLLLLGAGGGERMRFQAIAP